MKKLFLSLLLSSSFLIGYSQIKCVFFSDVPPLHRYAIMYDLQRMCRRHLPDTVSTVSIRFVKEPWCGNIFGYDANMYLDYLDTNIRTLGITYRSLSHHCTDEMLDGLTVENRSIITIYNVGNVRRLSKLAMHELGHSYGIYNHCKTKGCFMEGGGYFNQLKMYDREYFFCKKCKKILNEKVFNNR